MSEKCLFHKCLSGKNHGTSFTSDFCQQMIFWRLVLLASWITNLAWAKIESRGQFNKLLNSGFANITLIAVGAFYVVWVPAYQSKQVYKRFIELALGENVTWRKSWIYFCRCCCPWFFLLG